MTNTLPDYETPETFPLMSETELGSLGFNSLDTKEDEQKNKTLVYKSKP